MILNDFREWLSDNLRYILLILGILGILVALFFGVRAVSSRFDSENRDAFSSDSVVSVPEGTKIVSGNASSSIPVNDGGALAENAVPEVTALLTSYYNALGRQDVAAVKELCDTLPEAEAAKISASTTTYSDLVVYTKNGLVDGSYVVYAYYKYQNEGQTAALPGLSQMLVRKDTDGEYKIVYSDYDQATSDYIDSLAREDDVKALVARVQNEFNAAEQAASASKAASQAETSNQAGQTKQAPANQTTEGQTNTAPENQQTQPQTTPAPQPQTTPAPAQPKATPAPQPQTTPAPTAQPAQPQQEKPAAANTGERSTTVLANCNIRSNPGYDGAILGEIKQGTPVTVIGDIEKGWWHIRTGEYEGWVGRRFIN